MLVSKWRDSGRRFKLLSVSTLPWTTGYAPERQRGKRPLGVHPASGGILGVLLGNISGERGTPFSGGRACSLSSVAASTNGSPRRSRSAATARASHSHGHCSATWVICWVVHRQPSSRLARRRIERRCSAQMASTTKASRIGRSAASTGSFGSLGAGADMAGLPALASSRESGPGLEILPGTPFCQTRPQLQRSLDRWRRPRLAACSDAKRSAPDGALDSGIKNIHDRRQTC